MRISNIGYQDVYLIHLGSLCCRKDAMMEELLNSMDIDLENIWNFHLIAQEEIENGMRRHPDQAKEVDSLFMCMFPAVEFYGNERLYRVHCQQLIDNYIAGKLNAPTDPEVLILSMFTLSETSSGVKLNEVATLALMRLFDQVCDVASLDEPRIKRLLKSYEDIYSRQATECLDDLRDILGEVHIRRGQPRMRDWLEDSYYERILND